MTASESSPRKGQECDGESDVEQRVLREILKGQLDLVADEVRYLDGDLDELLASLRRAQAELSVLETLVAEYVEEPQDDESEE